jgi:hypothetical protein
MRGRSCLFGMSMIGLSETTAKPLTVTFSTAKKLSGVGMTSLWRLAKENRIEIVRVGRRTLITYRSLERLLLPEAIEAPQPRKRGRPRKHPLNEGRA